MVHGEEWLIDATGCDGELLRDGAVLRQLADDLIADLRLGVLGSPLWQQFPFPGGWTGIYLLRESHLACHTFPESGFATWNLYCCRPREPWEWQRELSLRLGATRIEVRRVTRGIATEPATVREFSQVIAQPTGTAR